MQRGLTLAGGAAQALPRVARHPLTLQQGVVGESLKQWRDNLRWQLPGVTALDGSLQRRWQRRRPAQARAVTPAGSEAGDGAAHACLALCCHQRRRNARAVERAQRSQQRRCGVGLELLGIALLRGVVQVDAVGASTQLLRQAQPDGLHQRLLLVVAQHLGQACGRAGKAATQKAGVAFRLAAAAQVRRCCSGPMACGGTCRDVCMLAPPVLTAVGLQEGEALRVPRLPSLLAVGGRQRRVGAALQPQEALHQAMLLQLRGSRVSQLSHGQRPAPARLATGPPIAPRAPRRPPRRRNTREKRTSDAKTGGSERTLQLASPSAAQRGAAAAAAAAAAPSPV